jgi:hypothetical protein
VLIASVHPLMPRTEANPGSLPIKVFNDIRANVVADRSEFWKELSMPFYGYNKPGAKISEGVRESFWLQGMMAGFPASYFCVKAFSETDQTEDLETRSLPCPERGHACRGGRQGTKVLASDQKTVCRAAATIRLMVGSLARISLPPIGGSETGS